MWRARHQLRAHPLAPDENSKSAFFEQRGKYRAGMTQTYLVLGVRVRIVWVKVKHVFWKLLETLRNLVYLPSWSSWRRFRLYFARKSPLWRR